MNDTAGTLLEKTALELEAPKDEKITPKAGEIPKFPVLDGTTLVTSPYRLGRAETTLFWTGYDMDLQGWADLRFRDSVYARYVKIMTYECQNHCSMRARVRVLSRKGCTGAENFYMVSEEGWKKHGERNWNLANHEYVVWPLTDKSSVKDHLMGRDPDTGKEWPRRNALSAMACQEECAKTKGCEYFITYFPGNAWFTLPKGASSLPHGVVGENLCYLQNRDSVPLPLSGRANSCCKGTPNFPQKPGIQGLVPWGQGRSVAGTKFCRSGHPGLYVQGSNLERRKIVKTPEQCQKLCAGREECEYFTFWADGGCELFSKYAKKVKSLYTTVPVWSGSKTCKHGKGAPASHRKSKSVCDLGGGSSAAHKKSAAASAFLEAGQDEVGAAYVGGNQENSVGTLEDGIGYVFGTNTVGRWYVKSYQECQLRCASTPSCYYFTHWSLVPGYCHLQTYDAILAVPDIPGTQNKGVEISGGRICRKELAQLKSGRDEDDPFEKVGSGRSAPGEKCESDDPKADVGSFLLAKWDIKRTC
eukprot:g14944.t1